MIGPLYISHSLQLTLYVHNNLSEIRILLHIFLKTRTIFEMFFSLGIAFLVAEICQNGAYDFLKTSRKQYLAFIRTILRVNETRLLFN